MSRSMYTLFVGGTLLDDVTGVLRDLQDGHPAMQWVMLVFVLISSFTVLNMLIGVLCEVVSATAANEEEKALVSEVRTRLLKVYGEIDTSGDGTLSKEEFMEMGNNQEVVESLELMGVETKHLFALSDSLFERDEDDIAAELAKLQAESPEGKRYSVSDVQTSKELEFDEFLDLLVRLRPEKDANVLDVAEYRKALRKCTRRLDAHLDELFGILESMKLLGKKQVEGTTTYVPGEPGGILKSRSPETKQHGLPELDAVMGNGDQQGEQEQNPGGLDGGVMHLLGHMQPERTADPEVIKELKARYESEKRRGEELEKEILAMWGSR